MKKYLFLFTALWMISFPGKAQRPDIANSMVHYKFTHLKDTAQPKKPYTENMILMLGKTSTVYKSYDRWLEDIEVRKQIKEQLAAGERIRIQRKGSGTTTEYYQFANERKLFKKAVLVHGYLIEEPLPVINWKIGTDTAVFGGCHCQKATTHYKGRDYTVWFCPDIPSQSGPWKLSGLPGLILEAYDTQKQVMFAFDGMEDLSKMGRPSAIPTAKMPPNEGSALVISNTMKLLDFANTDPRAIQLPADATKATEKEFTRLREAMIKDPNAFAQAELAALGANRPGGPKMVLRIELGPEDVIEKNPIELPETKK